MYSHSNILVLLADMYRAGVETVVKKSTLTRFLKKVQVPLAIGFGVYTASSVYGVHISEVSENIRSNVKIRSTELGSRPL